MQRIVPSSWCLQGLHDLMDIKSLAWPRWLLNMCWLLCFILKPSLSCGSLSGATHGRKMGETGHSHPLSQDAEAPEPLSLAQSHGLTGDATARPLGTVSNLCWGWSLHSLQTPDRYWAPILCKVLCSALWRFPSSVLWGRHRAPFWQISKLWLREVD